MIISSRANPTIKEIRSLRERKHREESGLFLVEGIRIVGEAVQAGAPVEQLIVAPDLLASEFARGLVAVERQAGRSCLEVTGEVFRSLSAKDNPQGLAAVVRQRWLALGDIRPAEAPWWVALSGVQDPGNLGTVLRTCDAVGCAGAILLGPTTDPYDPEAVRASMGALFSQCLVRATLPELAAWKAGHGYLAAGTSDKASVDYRAVTYPERLIVLMGSEQHGLSREEQALCAVLVRIPMVGRSDSLNLAVATGVVLYQIFNQRTALNSSGQTPRPA
jgi:RNA methyltransferase, TrmH family